MPLWSSRERLLRQDDGPAQWRPAGGRRWIWLSAVLGWTLTTMSACAGTGAPPAHEGAAIDPSGPPRLASPSPGAGSGAAAPLPSAATPSPLALHPPTPSATPRPRPLAELPLGGRTIFPRYRVVAYYGSQGGPALGVLGKGTPEQAAAAISQAAAPFAAYGRRVQPAMELIATVAHGNPGADSTYSYRLPDAVIDSYLAAARRHRMLLLLDIQPGRADFLTQVRQLEPYLKHPDVGIALDPEWKLTPGQLPLRQIGSSHADPINGVADYVSGLVTRYRLPEKLFVVHQFQLRMVPDRSAIRTRPGLAMVFHVDGQGPVSDKLATYAALRVGRPFHMGFKLFYAKDPVLMSPRRVMALTPQPELITYQ